MRRLVMALAAMPLLLAGCGDTDGDGDADLDPVAAAEQRVDARRGGPGRARSPPSKRRATSSVEPIDYITAVDRYGRLLTDAEATVGDVTTAGGDLEEPQDEASASANAAKDAREDVAAAEEELAEAQAALAEAEAGSTTADRMDDSTTTTAVPLVEPASVDRITEAQDDLDAAFEAVDDGHPVRGRRAGERGGLRPRGRLAAGPRRGGLPHRRAAGAGGGRDRRLHQRPPDLAHHRRASTTAPSMGCTDPARVDAVEAAADRRGLPATGFVDQATATALQEAVAATGAEAEAEAIAHTAAVQSRPDVGGLLDGTDRR